MTDIAPPESGSPGDGAAMVVLLYAPRRVETTAAVVRRLARDGGFRRVFVVLNGPGVGEGDAARFSGPGAEAIVVRHDNTGQEFGGYQAGIDEARSSGAGRFVVLNDTVGSHYHLDRHWLDDFRRAVLGGAADGFVCGMIDTSERRLDLAGLAGSRWVRTHLLALDRAALDAVGWRLYDPSLEDAVRPVADPDGFFGPAVGRTLCEHLAQHLFATTGNRWYGAEPLAAHNAARLAAKARSILQEKALSLRLDAAGVAFRAPVERTVTRWSVRIGRRFFRPRTGP